MVAYRTPASMTLTIFYQWAERFIAETAELRRKHKYILLTMDGFSGHISANTLILFKENNIIAVAIPAHTIHRLQVLYYTVFSPFKNSVQKGLNERQLSHATNARNDVFNLCEIIHYAYREALSYSNIVSGFNSCGLRNVLGGGLNPAVIRVCDISNREEAANSDEEIQNYKALYESFVQTRRVLSSYTNVVTHGYLNTREGSLMTSEQVINSLQGRDRQRREKEQEQAARAAARDISQQERRRAEEERVAQRAVRNF